MSRGERRGRVTPKRPNGWAAGDHGGPIRRRLRDATIFDRLLIVTLVFVVAAIITGAVYWRMSMGYRRGSYEPATVLMQKSGNDARKHFLMICFVGGVAGAIGYIILSLRDPYVTAASAKAEDDAEAIDEHNPKPDRFAFLAKRDQTDPYRRSDDLEDYNKPLFDDGVSKPPHNDER